ncbi:hypothetical protein AB1L42_11530 [Thalassoglobus sp. JC818]|uniref:WD40 repeat domain-containing protein n=1 Tax=Thalassoglobus sp. JC818 TaxID=3232136 RepID=UPI0034580E35
MFVRVICAAVQNAFSQTTGQFAVFVLLALTAMTFCHGVGVGSDEIPSDSGSSLSPRPGGMVSLSQFFVERGATYFETDPHRGLPWFWAAYQSEGEDPQKRAAHQFRLGLLIRDLPRLAGFWPRIRSADFSPDGRFLAVASGKTVTVYELPSVREVCVLEHRFDVVKFIFSRGSDRIVTVSQHQQGVPLGRVWSLSTGEPLTEMVNLQDQRYGLKGHLDVSFSGDDSKIIVIESQMTGRWHSKIRTQVFDSETLKSLSPVWGHHDQTDYGDYSVRSPDGLRILVPHGVRLDDAQVTQDGSGDWPDTILPQHYDLLTATEIHDPLDQVLEFYATRQILYHPDGSMIATTDNSTVRIWNALTGELVNELSVPPLYQPHVWLQFHENGQHLFVVGEDRMLAYDVEAGEVAQEWEGTGLSLSHGGRYYTEDFPSRPETHVKRVRLTLEDQDGSRPIRIPKSWSTRFSPREDRFVSRGARVRLFDSWMDTPQQVFSTVDGTPDSPPWRFDGTHFEQPFSNDSRFLLTIDSHGIWLWDLESRSSIVENFPDDQPREIVAATVNRQRDVVVLLEENRRVSTWDIQSSSKVGTEFELVQHNKNGDGISWASVIVDAESKTICAIGHYFEPLPEDRFLYVSVLQVHDVATGHPTTELIAFDQPSDSVLTGVNFLDNGAELIVTTRNVVDDQYVRTQLYRFDPSNGRLIAAVRELPGDVTLVDGSVHSEAVLLKTEMNQTESNDAGNLSLQSIEIERGSPVSEPIISNMFKSGPVTLSPDGRLAAVGGREIWDMQTGECIFTVEGTRSGASAGPVGFDPDVMGAGDWTANGQTFLVLNNTNGGDSPGQSQTRVFRPVEDVEVCPPITHVQTDARATITDAEGQILVAAKDGIRLWDLNTGQPISRRLIKDSVDWQSSSLRPFFSKGDGKLLFRTNAGIRSIPWARLRNEIPSDEVLRAWCLVLSDRMVDSSGGLRRVSTEEIEQACELILSSQALE